MKPPVPHRPDASSWPYPRWIAHRGAGRMAPENTLAAFRTGVAHGFRMFECDVKLSADNIPFLLHDARLERTTNGLGLASQLAWPELSRLDAGSWHSAAFSGEPIPALTTIAQFCQENDCLLNIEIKPTPGAERLTGELVARTASRLWQDATVPPLLTSFQIASLEAARAAVPRLPRGLLFDSPRTDWLEVTLALGCVAVVGKYTLWTSTRVAAARQAGLRCLAYTVNDARSAQRLLELGLDGLITDRIDRFNPSSQNHAPVTRLPREPDTPA